MQGALSQARRALRPDGLLLAAMMGGDTLQAARVPLRSHALPAGLLRADTRSLASITHRNAASPRGVERGVMSMVTAQELRIACTLAEQELEGGVSSRVSPFAQACSHPSPIVQPCAAAHDS